MDGGAVEVGDKVNKIQVFDFLNGTNSLGFKVRLEFGQPGGQCLDGAIGKVRQAAIGEKLMDKTMKHDGLLPFFPDHALSEVPCFQHTLR
jgi:hypothetical protein